MKQSIPNRTYLTHSTILAIKAHKAQYCLTKKPISREFHFVPDLIDEGPDYSLTPDSSFPICQYIRTKITTDLKMVHAKIDPFDYYFFYKEFLSKFRKGFFSS